MRAAFSARALGTVVALGLVAFGAGRLVGAIGSSGQTVSSPTDLSRGVITLFDGRVIPAMPKLLGVREQYELRLKWLEKKHAMLLPMMRKHGVGMWIIVNEEFHKDPVTEYVAPNLTYVSRQDVIAFVDGGPEGLKRFSNYYRPNADYARLIESFPAARTTDREPDLAAGLRVTTDRVPDLATGLKAIFEKYQPKTIALNMGGGRGQNSGLTHDTYKLLVGILGPASEERFVSAGDLIEDYFDTRLPDELEYYRAAVLATDIIAQRALSNEVIKPGVTRAVDVKWFFNQQIADLRADARPWFEIHVARQAYDPQTKKVIPYVHPAPDDVVFQRGDVVHLDCGFSYLGFDTDWQKVAYILREGETDVSPGLKLALKNGNATQEAIRTAPRPGMTGREATIAAMKQLAGVDFLPSLYSHAIGYQGHALGAGINARDGILGSPPKRDSVLRLGSYRSIELSATTKIPEWNGEKLLIPFEDDAYLTENGYEWFRPPQTKWYLIR